MEEELTQFEKIIESTFQLAAIVRAYYENLIRSGFGKEEAMRLTSQYQEGLLNMIRSYSGKNEG